MSGDRPLAFEHLQYRVSNTDSRDATCGADEWQYAYDKLKAAQYELTTAGFVLVDDSEA